jgi:subtilisin
MKRVLLVTSIAVVIFGMALFAGQAKTGAAQDNDRIPGQYIVVLNDSQDADAAAVELAGKHGLALGHIYKYALKGFSATIPENKLKALKSDPRVEFVSEDRVVSINAKDNGKVKPPPPPPPSQILPSGINRIDAELAAANGNKGAGINVAIIDTGIDLTHPDLAANIVGGKNCQIGKSYADGNGHGTHVAGIVAALDNSRGVVGAAPEAKLWSIRVLNNSGSGSWSSVICGIDFVTSKAPANGGPITVANMSLSGPGASDNDCGKSNNDALHKAICRSRDAGVTYVVAAGNESADTASSVPAAYDDAVITVSALADSDGLPGGIGSATGYGADDTFASFSNYGAAVDLGAPGVDIYSTWKGGAYATASGTSMASPHVAGAAALYLKDHPGANWTQVLDGLKALAEIADAGHSDPSGLHPEPIAETGAL